VRITFVLPSTGEYPSGGAKVVYEYASGLAQRGHKVIVVHLPYHSWSGNSLSWHARRLISYAGRASGLTGTYTPRSWLSVDPKVELRFVPYLSRLLLPHADLLIATAWQTAELICRFPLSYGRKIYFIHDYEHYMAADRQVRERIGATFRVGMHNLVTSPAGAQMVTECGGEVNSSIPNGLDFRIFALHEAVVSPKRNSIGFPTRPESFKGTADALAALRHVYATLGGIVNVWSFGLAPSSEMPGWITFYPRPSSEELAGLYNRSKIFLVPSHYEGWGLPGAEAMACGAALVSTDNGGVRAYAHHEVNALLVPPQQPAALAAEILRLVRHPELRVRLAEAGYQSIQRFTWTQALDAFEKIATTA